MKTSIICVNDFPKLVFAPSVPAVIVEQQRKLIKEKYGKCTNMTV